MSNIKSFLLLLLLFVTGSIYAADKFSVDAVTLTPGETSDIIINCEFTSDNITLYQLDLYLPNGVTLAKNSNGRYAAGSTYVLSDRHNEHIVSIAEREGFYRLVVSNASLHTITPEGGELLRLKIDANNSVSGTLMGSIKKFSMFATDEAEHAMTDVNFELTVIKLATSIVLNKPEATLEAGSQEQLTATVLPSDAAQSVTWTSSDPSVASVDKSGLVTAVAVGNATITASTTDGTDLKATCAVTVFKLATSIALNKPEATLEAGSQEQLTATVLPSDAEQTVTWTSSDPSVASVDKSGLVTAVAVGNATITASTTDGTDLKATCAVTVFKLATSIALNKPEATLEAGLQEQLTATVLPSDAAQSVTWTSSDSSVATVDKSGLVTAVAVGNATITAGTTDGTDLKATCAVTVFKLATSIALNKPEATLEAGSQEQLTATVLPSDAAQSVTWTSSDPSIASVDKNGLVTAVAVGNATITASTTDGTDLKATCAVTVFKLATSIVLNKPEATLEAGLQEQLTATVLPSDAAQSVTWTSSDPSVASVDKNGLVTAVAVGNATITASTTDGTDLKATCAVTVFKLATSIVLNKPEATLEAGLQEQLTATVLPSDAAQSVTWTSSDPSVASVDKSGLVTAVAVGNATITASTTDGTDLKATCEVTVFKLATSIVLNKPEATLEAGSQEQLTATVLPSDAAQSVTWTSSDPSVASVDKNGLVTAVAVGNATITACTTDGTDLKATCAVTVFKLATSIVLNKPEATLEAGLQEQLTATVLPSDAAQSVTWTSSDPSVASVDKNGLVTAVAVGNATITASTTDGTDLKATCAVTVFKLATSIVLNKPEATLEAGLQEQLTATVLPSDAAQSVTWTSSDPSVASVDKSGLVTAVAVGNATITASTTDGTDLKATCEVTVFKLATSIVLNKPEATLEAGSQEQLTATVLPSDAAQSVTWTSSDPSVASVDKSGLVTAVAVGNATITASTTDGTDLKATCEVTVIRDDLTGKCGENLDYVFSDDRVLTISGAGAMYDYGDNNQTPWDSYSESILSVMIGNSVTSIGNCAFRNCSGLTSIVIPSSVTSIGQNAFSGCDFRTIVSKAVSPTNYSLEDVGFSAEVFDYTVLYVPEDAYWDYVLNSDWSRFSHIKECATTEVQAHQTYMIAEADGTNYTVYNSSLEALEVKESALLVDETSLGCSWVAEPYGNGYALMNLGAEKYADIDAEGHISLSDSPKTLDIEFHDGMPTINGHALMMVINDKVTEVVNLRYTPDANASIYDLSGRQLSKKPARGYYIRGGKKYYVK